MDIGGINKIKPVTMPNATNLRKNSTAGADERDGDGRQHQRSSHQPTQLSPEQEEEALQTLNALPAFVRSGLTARLVKESDKAPHIVVQDAQGTVVRHIPYSDMIQIYVNRKSGSDKGTLLKRSA